MCRFTAKFTVRKADQDTNNWLCFPSCTLCWYSATFSWCTLCWYLGRLYTLLVSWYVLLVVHFVGNLVRFPGCTLCWYLGRFCWLYTLLVILVPFLFVHFVGILVVNLAVNLHIVSSVQKLDPYSWAL